MMNYIFLLCCFCLINLLTLISEVSKGQKRKYGRELSEKAQKKRRRFDPMQQLTVTSLQNQLLDEDETGEF